MGYARHIGRVGALAIALGVGVGAAWTPGIAAADPSDGDSSSSSSADAGSGTGAEKDKDKDKDKDNPGDTGSAASSSSSADKPNTSSAGGHTATPSRDHSDDADEPSTDDTDATSTTPTEEAGDADASVSSPDTGGSKHAVPDVPPTPPSPVTGETLPSTNKTASATKAPPTGNPSPLTSARATDTHQSRQVAPLSADTQNDSSAATPVGAVPVTASRRTTLSVNAIQPAALPPSNPLADLVAAPARIVSAVVAALLSPILAPATPATPAPTMLWAVLAWVRQEVNRTFFNRAPRLAASPTDVEQVDDVVTGTLVGTDPDGDPVSYSVTPTTAKGGTVAIDAAGNFSYIAPADWNGVDALTDTFTVSLADNGFHVHGLLGLLFGGGHATTREVTVQLTGSIAGVAETTPVAVPSEWRNPRVTVGPGGTVAVTQQFGSGTAEDPFQAQILVQGPGRPPVLASAAGYVSGRPLIADDGTVYVTTLVFPEGTFDVTATNVTSLQPGKPSVSWTIGRPIQGPELTSAGDYVVTTATGGGAPTDTQTTVVIISDGQKRDALTIAGSTDSPATIGRDGTIVLTASNALGGTTIGVLRPGTAADYLELDETIQGPATVADDGTVVFTTSEASGFGARTVAAGAVGAAATPTLWVWRAGESAVSIPTDDTIDNLVTGGRGTVAYATSTGSGSATDPVVTTVTVLRPGSPNMVSTTTGALVALMVGADGTVAYNTYTPTASSTVPMTLTFLRPDGSEGTATFTTTYQFLYRPTVGADGTVGAMWVDNGTTVAVFRPSKAMITETSSYSITTAPEVGTDGTVAFVVGIGAGTAEEFSQIFVMRPGQQTRVASIYGLSRGLTVTGDGTVVHSSRVDRTLSYVMVLRPNGDSVIAPAPGLISNPARVGPDGVVYLPTDVETGGVNVTIVNRSNRFVTVNLPGRSSGFSIDSTGGGTDFVTATIDASGGVVFTIRHVFVVSV